MQCGECSADVGHDEEIAEKLSRAEGSNHRKPNDCLSQETKELAAWQAEVERRKQGLKRREEDAVFPRFEGISSILTEIPDFSNAKI